MGWSGEKSLGIVGTFMVIGECHPGHSSNITVQMVHFCGISLLYC